MVHYGKLYSNSYRKKNIKLKKRVKKTRRELNRKHCVQFTTLNSYIDIDQLYFLL